MGRIDHKKKIGTKFSNLTILSIYDSKNKKGINEIRCKYRCDCGNIRNTSIYKVTSGKTKSCGCLGVGFRTHGMRNTSEYNIWCSMRRRCNKTYDSCYHNYGKKGITVCDEWDSSFVCFYSDMGPRPSSIHSIDRIDNSKGYFKENCRWATKIEQSNNTKRNVFLNYNGDKLTLRQLSEKYNVPLNIIRSRYEKGHDIDKIMKF